MTRIIHVKKARLSKVTRTCRRCGHSVQVGESFYWLSSRLGNTSLVKYFCSKHQPKPSEITTSRKLSRMYGALETLDEQNAQEADDATDVVNWLSEAVKVARDVADEYEESRSNMESAFPNGCPVMVELQEKYDACKSWINELESATNELENVDLKPEREEFSSDEEHAEALTAWRETIRETVQVALEAFDL